MLMLAVELPVGFAVTHREFSYSAHSLHVMPGLVPGIHDFPATRKDVDGRDKPGHDEGETQ
jgi:hypothetical protein